MLELWCVSPQTGARWKLEFSVREEELREERNSCRLCFSRTNATDRAAAAG